VFWVTLAKLFSLFKPNQSDSKKGEKSPILLVGLSLAFILPLDNYL
jgi:hypothetical protein